jgi:hypothetical protein
VHVLFLGWILLGPHLANNVVFDIFEDIELGVIAKPEFLQIFPELLEDPLLLFEMEGDEDLQIEGDEYGGALDVLLQRLILVEAVVPVVDLGMQVVLDQFSVLVFLVVDVDELLQVDQLVLVEPVLRLDQPDLLLFQVELLLLAR